MKEDGLFLATYATAALVNLSQARETVKNFVMAEGIAKTCLNQLHSHDDDLVRYTLVLLVHLTKSVHHRKQLKDIGIIKVLTHILTDFYNYVDRKRRILTELASVLGQMCNDEETRKIVCDGVVP